MSATTRIRILKVNTLPVKNDWTPDTIYFVKESDDKMSVHYTSQDATIARRLPTTSDIQTMIDTALVTTNNCLIVNTIADRNALVLHRNTPVWVIDATTDPTVSVGAALYLYNSSATTWTKISEAESLDLILSWDSITGRPMSSPQDIDDAVSKKHSHANKQCLDQMNEDTDGELVYKNLPIGNKLINANW